MRSILNLWDYPAGRSLVSDDITEFHAVRLLLLLAFCGANGHIDGLTKLAKLDFFVRYPQFFNKVSSYVGQVIQSSTVVVESKMIRYRYGPWDKRYYDILSYLRSKDLIAVEKDKKGAFRFQLTESGIKTVTEIAELSEFNSLIDQMKKVKKFLGAKSGSALKNLIYEVFEEEVAQRPLDEVI
jgi:DNA-binding PadR family transcriptional regulator